ncbi:hypothetical protein [Actinomyces gerencseriae]|uniref:hypothetical protein n=1 Tax=Actinomyces gerencseriae TaxID=52769 RepID=UPI0004053ABE|nr:hypothetical protein [Actinomyces gerencseriae]
MTVPMAAPAPSPSPPPGALRPPGAPPGPVPGGAVAGRSALEVVLPALLISVALVSTAAITIVDYDDSSVGPVFAAASLVLGDSGTWVLVAGIVLCLRRRAAVGASASLLAVTPVVLADWNIVSRILMGVILIAVPLLIALVLPLASPPREEPRPAALQLSQGAVVVLTLDPVVFLIGTLHGLMGYPAYPHDSHGWEFSPDPPGVYVGFTVILLLGAGALVAVRLRSSRLLYAGLVTAQVVSWIVLGVVEGGALGEYVATMLTLILALLVWTRPVGRWFAGTWTLAVGRSAVAPAPVAPYVAPQQILGADGRIYTVVPAQTPAPFPTAPPAAAGAPVPAPLPGTAPEPTVPHAAVAPPETSAPHVAAETPEADRHRTRPADSPSVPHAAAAPSGAPVSDETAASPGAAATPGMSEPPQTAAPSSESAPS